MATQEEVTTQKNTMLCLAGNNWAAANLELCGNMPWKARLHSVLSSQEQHPTPRSATGTQCSTQGLCQKCSLIQAA